MCVCVCVCVCVSVCEPRVDLRAAGTSVGEDGFDFLVGVFFCFFWRLLGICVVVVPSFFRFGVRLLCFASSWFCGLDWLVVVSFCFFCCLLFVGLDLLVVVLSCFCSLCVLLFPSLFLRSFGGFLILFFLGVLNSFRFDLSNSGSFARGSS